MQSAAKSKLGCGNQSENIITNKSISYQALPSWKVLNPKSKDV